MREDSLYSSRRDTPPRPSSTEKAFMARPPEESGGRRGVQEGLKLGLRQPRQNSAFPFLVAPSSAASALVSGPSGYPCGCSSFSSPDVPEKRPGSFL